MRPGHPVSGVPCSPQLTPPGAHHPLDLGQGLGGGHPGHPVSVGPCSRHSSQCTPRQHMRPNSPRLAAPPRSIVGTLALSPGLGGGHPGHPVSGGPVVGTPATPGQHMRSPRPAAPPRRNQVLVGPSLRKPAPCRQPPSAPRRERPRYCGHSMQEGGPGHASALAPLLHRSPLPPVPPPPAPTRAPRLRLLL